MSHIITLIPGDGIGPEVTEAVVRIFKAAALDIDWERHDAGVIAFKQYDQSLPPALLDSIRRNKVALKGPVTTPIAEGFTSVNVGLRKALDLYANLRPVRNLPGRRRAASPASTSSSSARTPRTCTPGSSTRSSPASSRASRSSPRRRRRAYRSSPSSTRGRTAASA